MKRPAVAVLILLTVILVLSPIARAQELRPPIIDMHLHALGADANGPPPTGICAPGMGDFTHEPARDWGEQFTAMMREPPCKNPVWGPKTDDEVMQQTLEILERRNIYGVTSGRPDLMERWVAASPDRIIPALWFGEMLRSTPDPDEMRQFFENGDYELFSEVAIQYDGISPSDDSFEPYLAVAEDLDVPMGIHIGTGPPGVLYRSYAPNYRARLHSPLVLEEALVRHPKLRVYIMHAGWPMLDDLLAVLYAHPRVHVDIGIISYILPRKEFHRYLQRIVESGFGKRVMFGSDQMNWPGAIEIAIESIETANFLTSEQKRDIFYNNAARFLRLSDEEISIHHGR